MPRGKPNPKPAPPPVDAGTPAPLILIQPRPDGTLLDIYGLQAAEAIDELRLAMLHLVASQSGVPIIREVVTRQTAVLAKPAPQPNPNGAGPRKYTKAPVRRVHEDDGEDVLGDVARSW